MDREKRLKCLLKLCEMIDGELPVCERIRKALKKGTDIHLREYEKKYLHKWIVNYPELFSGSEKRVFEIYRKAGR